MTLKNKKYKKGFTLIELLVVISIIGLLSSIVLSSLAIARSKGRDAKRIADMIELRNALELYASANNGNYPQSPSLQINSQVGTFLNPFLSPTYIPFTPSPPSPTIYGYISPTSAGNNYTCDGVAGVNLPYTLIFTTENLQTNRTPLVYNSGSGGVPPYAITNTLVTFGAGYQAYCLTNK